jgi:hypothetical protein
VIGKVLNQPNLSLVMSPGHREELKRIEISISDPHRFYADPDPAFLLNAGPDPDPDPDPTCRIEGFLTAANFWFN